MQYCLWVFYLLHSGNLDPSFPITPTFRLFCFHKENKYAFQITMPSVYICFCVSTLESGNRFSRNFVLTLCHWKVHKYRTYFMEQNSAFEITVLRVPPPPVYLSFSMEFYMNFGSHPQPNTP
jgi:hypothetical protein